MFKIWFFVCLSTVVFADDSPLGYLNGQNHQLPVTVAPGGPEALAASQITQISGSLILKDSLTPITVRDAKVRLLHDGKVLLETSSSQMRDFTMTGHLKTGTYELQLVSAKYVGKQTLSVQSTRIENIQLMAEPK